MQLRRRQLTHLQQVQLPVQGRVDDQGGIDLEKRYEELLAIAGIMRNSTLQID